MRENKNNPGGSQGNQDRSNQNLSEKQRDNQNLGQQGQQQFRGTSGMQGGQGGTHARNEPGVRNPGQQNVDEPAMSDEDEIGGAGRPEHGRDKTQEQRRNDQ